LVSELERKWLTFRPTPLVIHARFPHPQRPVECAVFDPRGIIRHSTRIRVADDRIGRRPTRVAQTLNEALEFHWSTLATRRSASDPSRYRETRRRARTLGYDYVSNEWRSQARSGK